jgi:hypothetical protein
MLGLAADLAFLGRGQFHACPACLRQSDRDGLLWRTCAMLALAHVVYFLPNKFAGLRAGRFSSLGIFPGSLERFSLRHFSISLFFW